MKGRGIIKVLGPHFLLRIQAFMFNQNVRQSKSIEMLENLLYMQFDPEISGLD
uniref:Uncharacterized protein n=1 Tax=Meloidogyne enterolobii TaxID=390850 RepID=A0A6V7W5G2_MELEN|nr:unnamed protein product [Meloidogyne enterolobii]